MVPRKQFALVIRCTTSHSFVCISLERARLHLFSLGRAFAGPFCFYDAVYPPLPSPHDTGDSHSDRVPSSSSPSSQPPPAPKPNPFGNAKPVNIPDPTLRDERPPRAVPPPAKEPAEAEPSPAAASGSAASLSPSTRSGEDVSGSTSSSSGVGRYVISRWRSMTGYGVAAC